MKIASRLLSLLVIVMITAFYTGCKKDDDDKKTEEETQLAKLNGVWNLESASDGDPRTDDFENLVLTLSGNYVEGGTYDYSFTGERPNPSPWPVSGKWKFGSPKTSQMVRDPGTPSEIAMTYTVNDTNLEISFTVPEGSTGWQGSRVKSVTGNWTFVFTK